MTHTDTPRIAAPYCSKILPATAKQQGYRAAQEELPRSSCRYPVGSRNRTAWLQGYWHFLQGKTLAGEPITAPSPEKNPYARRRAYNDQLRSQR